MFSFFFSSFSTLSSWFWSNLSTRKLTTHVYKGVDGTVFICRRLLQLSLHLVKLGLMQPEHRFKYKWTTHIYTGIDGIFICRWLLQFLLHFVQLLLMSPEHTFIRVLMVILLSVGNFFSVPSPPDAEVTWTHIKLTTHIYKGTAGNMCLQVIASVPSPFIRVQQVICVGDCFSTFSIYKGTAGNMCRWLLQYLLHHVQLVLNSWIKMYIYMYIICHTKPVTLSLNCLFRATPWSNLLVTQ